MPPTNLEKSTVTKLAVDDLIANTGYSVVVWVQCRFAD